MYNYWGFGLRIRSEIAFPELLHADQFESCDLAIFLGKTPEKLDRPETITKRNLWINPNEFLLKVPGVATYYATNGNRIIIQQEAGAQESAVRLFLLSNAIAAILHQQNKIPFHASGIIHNDKVLLFTGPSGIGKSTLLYSLLERGYELFTDDVCVLSMNNTGNIEAFASYPMMKLWENTIDLLPSKDYLKDYQLRPNVAKYGVFLHNSFSTRSYLIDKILVLEKYSGTSNEVHQVAPLQSFNLLQKNTYRREFVDYMQLHTLHFQLTSQLTRQARIYHVKRSVSSDISSFASFIQTLI